MPDRPELTSLSVNLLDGEDIDFSTKSTTVHLDDATLNSRYITEGVRIVIEQARYPLNQILTMFSDTFETNDGRIEFKYKRDPEYQRRHRWDIGRQSRLIESFLMNVPVPPVFLYEYDLARFEVMDGRQRLTALMEFYEDSFELSDLEYWPELNGRTYSRLPSSIRDGIDRRYLSSIILLNETAATPERAAFLKKLVFERLNSGGVRLSGQETRNAVFDGPLNDLCLELSRLSEFRSMLGTPQEVTLNPATTSDLEAGDEGSDPDELIGTEGEIEVTAMGRKMFESMEDVEIVLRFFAYRHMSSFSQALNRVTEFLDEFLVIGNQLAPSVIKSYRSLFVDNIKFWYAIGGSAAFQVAGSNRRFSKIAFDALMYASSALVGEQREELLADPERVRRAIAQMYSQDAAVFGGRRTNSTDARQRNAVAFNALENVLADSPKDP